MSLLVSLKLKSEVRTQLGYSEQMNAFISPLLEFRPIF